MTTKASTDTLCLQELTYYRVGGPVDHACFPRSFAELQSFLSRQVHLEKPLALLGAGSNTLCSDERFPGWVLSCRGMTGVSLLESEPGRCTLLVEAGVSSTECAQWGLELGFLDLAWMHRMPGQLGATVRMNARCFGGEISQVVSHVFTVDLTGMSHCHEGEKVFRGYKDTLLMERPEVVYAAVLVLKQPAPRDEIQAEMDRCEAARHARHHFDHPSCGSAFKNNYAIGRPSGQIFDELGFKGRRRGGAGVSEHHGNFIFNYGQAKAEDILGLAAEMRQAALKRGYDLSLEVEPMGSFERSLAVDAGFQQGEPSTAAQESRSLGPTEGLLEHVSLGLLASPSRPVVPGPGHEGHPVRLCDLPFAEWPRDAGDSAASHPPSNVSLGLVRFCVTQLRPWDGGGAGENSPLLRFEFLCPDALTQQRLLQPPPSRKGFQDKLWESSVFEVFIHSAEGPEYLELEIHDEMSWLSLRLRGPRSRHPEDDKPRPLQGVVPWREGASLGFDLSAAALSTLPSLAKGCLLIGAAYTGVPGAGASLGSRGVRLASAEGENPARIFAVSPPRSPLESVALAPDFHRRDALVSLSLLGGRAKD